MWYSHLLFSVKLNTERKVRFPMAIIRSGFDRRSNINRRGMRLDVRHDRRSKERRNPGERRHRWIRTSEWSSTDINIRNQYYWAMINQDIRQA